MTAEVNTVLLGWRDARGRFGVKDSGNKRVCLIRAEIVIHWRGKKHPGCCLPPSLAEDTVVVTLHYTCSKHKNKPIKQRRLATLVHRDGFYLLTRRRKKPPTDVTKNSACRLQHLPKNRHMRMLSCLALFVWAWEKQRGEGRMVRASSSCIHRCSCKNILIHMFPSTCLFPGNLALQHEEKNAALFSY